jgi:hypothetical protein
VTWALPLARRRAQLDWLLDHGDDLDADFLAIYGIDLEQQDIGGRRYVQLAQRITAYQGVMAARVAAEQDQHSSSGAPAPSSRPRDTEELELDEFQQQFPDLVSVSRVPQQ